MMKTSPNQRKVLTFESATETKLNDIPLSDNELRCKSEFRSQLRIEELYAQLNPCKSLKKED